MSAICELCAQNLQTWILLPKSTTSLLYIWGETTKKIDKVLNGTYPSAISYLNRPPNQEQTWRCCLDTKLVWQSTPVVSDLDIELPHTEQTWETSELNTNKFGKCALIENQSGFHTFYAQHNHTKTESSRPRNGANLKYCLEKNSVFQWVCQWFLTLRLSEHWRTKA